MKQLTIGPGIVAVLMLTVTLQAATYEATLTGTFSTIDLDGAEPGVFSDLTPGDAYSFTFRVDPTPHPVPSQGVIYEVVSASLGMVSGGTPLAFGPESGGDLVVSADPGSSYLLGFRQAFAGISPFSGVRFALLDSDGDPTLTRTDLPLTLDLGAFAAQRELALVGDVAIAGGHLYPIAHASIDTFSARIIPGVGTGGMLVGIGLGALTRRRRAG